MNKKIRSIKGTDIYNHAEEILLVIMFIILVLVIFLQVVMRYVFNNSLSWTEAMGRYIFVWMSWIGVSLGARKGEHIKITSLVDKLPFRSAHFFNILSEILVIGICVITIYYGIEICTMLINLGARDEVLKINPAVGFAAVPVGCGLQLFRSIQAITISTKILSTKSHPAERLGGDN